MNESGVWNTIKSGMEGKWDASRIESSSGNGVPDVTFGLKDINGWIELKHDKEWPKREATLVKLPLRPEQKLWINRRGKLAGNVWVIYRVSNDFFILWWNQIDLACEGWTRAQWPAFSYFHWERRVDFTQLYRILKGEL
jgi:hypothetical protein